MNELLLYLGGDDRVGDGAPVPDERGRAGVRADHCRQPSDPDDGVGRRGDPADLRGCVDRFEFIMYRLCAPIFVLSATLILIGVFA
jgi:hypothetical protein